MATWALCSLADATIFIAEVIFNVFLTDAILLFISFNDDILTFCFGVVGLKTLAARGLVNGRGPPRSGGRDLVFKPTTPITMLP